MQRPVQGPDASRRLIVTEDGAELSGTLYLPDGAARAALVLNGATGVDQAYYHAFATWAARERGFAVLTYDYRGMGQSATGRLRDCRATMSDWGLRDNAAARSHLKHLFPDLPLWVLGHSLGAMLLPMQGNIDGIDRVIGVGSGLVHHRDHPWPYRGLALYFWYGLPPFLSRLMGYMPGRALGFGSDMPASAFDEWRRWCTTPNAVAWAAKHRLPAPEWSRSGAPVRLLSISDDDLVPEACTRRLSELYDGAATIERINPLAHGLTKVGHISAFARRNSALWNAVLGCDAAGTPI